jgi:tetratricopeptide (TPR) repeat protein
LLATLLACVCALWLFAESAVARSSRSSRSRDSRGGRHRVIDDIDERDRDRGKKREEDKKKGLEERKKKAEAKKKAKEEKKKKAAEKKALQAKRKEGLGKAKKLAKRPSKKTSKSRPAPPAAAGKNADTAAREKGAAELLGKAEAELGEGKLLSGVALLRQAVEGFAGTPAAEEAERWLAHLLAQEKHGTVIYLGEAEELFEAQRYRQAQNKYLTLLAKFPKSEQADAARERLAEIKEGDLLSKTAYTTEELEDARLWFLAGNIHLENGRRTKAVNAYRKAIEGYPGCPYAEQAAEKVAALRR